MNIYIKHKDNSMVRLYIKKIDSYQCELEVSQYDNEGYYRPGASWKQLTNIDDIKKQLDYAYYNLKNEVKQILPSGKIIDYKIVVI